MFKVGDRVIEKEGAGIVQEVMSTKMVADGTVQLIKTDINTEWVGAGFFEPAGILPYLVKAEVVYTKHYNPDYGDGRECTCGHTYHEHFRNNLPVLYCEGEDCYCREFEQA